MGQPDAPADRPRSLGWLAVVGIAAGLLIGLAPSVGSRLFDRGSGEHISIDDLPPGGQVDVAALTVSHATDAPASPQATVEAFLDALLADDGDRSFELLSQADRDRFRSAGAWNTARIQMFGSVEAAELHGPALERAGESIESTLTLEPELSDVAGLVPGTLDVVWRTVEESGWRIQLTDSTAVPVFPDESAAADAAAVWLSSNDACTRSGGPAVGRREADVLRSFGGAHDELCANAAEVTVAGAAMHPDPLTIAALSSRFGPDAESWARTVPVSGPFTGRLLLAPIGDEWVVIDVLPPPAS